MNTNAADCLIDRPGKGLLPDRRSEGRQAGTPAKKPAQDPFRIRVLTAESGNAFSYEVLKIPEHSLSDRQRVISEKHKEHGLLLALEQDALTAGRGVVQFGLGTPGLPTVLLLLRCRATAIAVFRVG